MANRGLHALALGTFAETSAQIMRENMTQLMQTRAVGRWVLITAAVLAVPLLAMAFKLGVPDPGSGTEDGVNWGPMDFATVGVLILGAGLLFEFASARGGSGAHRAAVGIAVAAGLWLVWVNLAVGMMDVEGNPANLMYVLVLSVALVGAAIGRFEPREASIAMFATAGAHALVAVIALVADLGSDAPGGRVLHRGVGRIGPAVPSGESRFRSGGLTRTQAVSSDSGVGAPSGQAAMQTLLPERSARIHEPGAPDSSTTRPPAATAACMRASAWSRATETSTCMAWRSGLFGSRSCIQTVEPWPSGSMQLSSCIGA